MYKLVVKNRGYQKEKRGRVSGKQTWIPERKERETRIGQKCRVSYLGGAGVVVYELIVEEREGGATLWRILDETCEGGICIISLR